MRLKFYIVFLCFISPVILFSQATSILLNEGDEAYRAEEYDKAELSYRKARQANSDMKSNFNLGNTTYKQERYEEAVDHYLNAANKISDKLIASDNYFNLGNAYFKNEQYEEAIDSYKQSIRANPENDEARYNLLMLKLALKEQQDQQQQQQNQENQNQENQDQQSEDQQGQDQQNQNESEEQQDQDQQNQGEENQDSLQNQPPSGGEFDSTRLEKQSLDSLDAVKLLQIIQSEEQKLQEKLRKFDSNRNKPDKDW